MCKKLIFAMLLILAVPITASAQQDTIVVVDTTDGSGWYQLSGIAWSGIDIQKEGQFGFCMGLGRWFNLGNNPHFFLTTPITMQVGLGSDDETGLIGFNPQVALQIGRVILTTGSGITKYYADNGSTTYGQLDGSLTVVVSDKRLFSAEITFAARYLPGNKHKTVIFGMTILD